LYFRFNLSFRDVDELVAERGVDVSYESLRQWVDKFGYLYAKRLRSGSERPPNVWYLDEIFTKIKGKKVYIWRAVDDEGTVLEVLVQSRKNRKAALRLLRKLLKKQGVRPKRIVTDKLGSYGAALRHLGQQHLQDVGERKNNRAECSHVPIRRRERKTQKFRSMKSAQRLLSARSQIYNLFNFRRHLISRSSLRKFRHQAQNQWDVVTASVCA